MLRPDKPYVFVSYSSKDDYTVHQEIQRIESERYNVWYDKSNIHPGSPWDDEIRAAIRGCCCFVVFVTRNATLSIPVKQEMKRAFELNKPIICIYWEGIKLPSPFHEIQGIERYRLLTPVYREQLGKALSRYIQPIDLPAGDDSYDVKIDPPNISLGISPKLTFFILVLSALFFLLFAVGTMITPFLVTENPSDPLSNRLAGILAGCVLTAVALGLGIAAFAVHWKHLRRKK